MLKFYYADITLLEETEVFDAWLSKVNTQRREKVLRCKQQKDRQRSLLAGVLLRYALEMEGMEYDSLKFARTNGGKPYLESHENLHFSLSHAGDYAGCLLSDAPVGIDIEHKEKAIFQTEKSERLLSMAEKCLAPAEWDLWKECKEPAEKFIEYWTRKEAYSKAVGKGLGMDFSKIDTETNRQDFWSVWIADGYCVSIYDSKRRYKTYMYDELTAKDIQKMEEEIEHRKLVIRKQALEDVKEARAHGDLSENFEYKAAKKFKNENESRIRYLEKMIRTAKVISEDSAEDEVGMNNTVELYFEEDDETEVYKIVTTVRSNSLKNLISKESPLGAAIYGHKVGDRCEVKVNDTYSYFVEIKKIENTVDDGSDALRKF